MEAFTGHQFSPSGLTDVRIVVDAPWLPSDPASADDRKWFEQHPKRRLRLRQFYASSFATEFTYMPGQVNFAHWVLIIRLESGIRLRVPLAVRDQIPRLEPSTDAEVSGIVANHAGLEIGPLVSSK